MLLCNSLIVHPVQYGTMNILVVVAPDKFRDEELMEPLTVFDEYALQYDIASTRKGICKGMLGASVEATLGGHEKRT